MTADNVELTKLLRMTLYLGLQMTFPCHIHQLNLSFLGLLMGCPMLDSMCFLFGEQQRMTQQTPNLDMPAQKDSPRRF